MKLVKKKGKNSKNKVFNGDNLKVMKLMESKYTNKIDLIYIDPPYNTGKSKMGKYSDNFGGHENWVSFIEPRLEQAKKLLKDDGLIFISINEYEYAYLKILCNKVFKEQNFVSSIIWQCKYTVSNDKKGITSQTEYILVYAKDINNISIHNDPLREEYVNSVYKNLDNDPRGLWRAGVQLYKKKNPKSYTVTSPTGKEWTMPWNYNEEGWKRLEKNNLIWWGKDGNSCPQKKVFLKDSKGRGIRNLWLGEEVGYTADGGNELENMTGNRNDFIYPKPRKLIERILQIAGKEDSLVMDFFAGSGTTGHAVLNYNQEHNTKMNFILITNNENNICEDVTVKRIETAISGYSYKKGKKVNEIKGLKGDFSYFKLEE